eukprot:2158833-Prymnesium_polylepis.1
MTRARSRHVSARAFAGCATEWLCTLDDTSAERTFYWAGEGAEWRLLGDVAGGSACDGALMLRHETTAHDGWRTQRQQLLEEAMTCEHCGAVWPAGSISYNSFHSYRSKCKRRGIKCRLTSTYHKYGGLPGA